MDPSAVLDEPSFCAWLSSVARYLFGGMLRTAGGLAAAGRKAALSRAELH
jgi:hypothetical protein